VATSERRFSIDDAERFFVGLAERNGLSFIVKRQPYVELVVTLPAQPRLSFEIHLLLQNVDELCIQLKNYSSSYFPSANPDKRACFEDAVQGLISGQYRILSHVRPKWTGWIKSHLQSREQNGWKNLTTYRSFGFPFGRVVTTIVQNRNTSEIGPKIVDQ
jgi:hypothetical protein